MYRLADRLGYANPDAMLQEMTPEQLCEWRVYLEGQGAGDDQQAAALVASSQANEIRVLLHYLQLKLGDKPRELSLTKPDDYTPRWREATKAQRRQTPAEILRALK